MSGTEKIIELKNTAGDMITCRSADTFWKRFRGFMGQSRPVDNVGLLIRPCDSIHMFFMKFSLDILFLDRDNRIVRIVRDLAPGKVIGTVKHAYQVVEVPSGTLPDSFEEGDTLEAISV